MSEEDVENLKERGGTTEGNENGGRAREKMQ